MKIYTYKQCSTCRKATKWLDSAGIEYEEIAIRENPPSKAEISTMLDALGGEIKKLFNTSGVDYRSMGMKDKLPTLSQNEAFELLSSNGNLVKRPFLLSEKWNTVGFKEADWQSNLAKG